MNVPSITGQPRLEAKQPRKAHKRSTSEWWPQKNMRRNNHGLSLGNNITFKYLQEAHVAATIASEASRGLRLVMGVMSEESRWAQRDEHRMTWFSQPLVCREKFDDRPGCMLVPKFVCGPLMGASAELTTADIFSVNSSEPGLKSRLWWLLAPSAFTGQLVTHLGKMDMDTFPVVSHILGELEKYREHAWSYYGSFLGARDCDKRLRNPRRSPADPHKWIFRDCNKECCCPPPHCTREESFVSDAKRSFPCWSYAGGGLYILSSALANEVSSRFQPIEPNYGCEDMRIGALVNQSVHARRFNKARKEQLKIIHGAGCDLRRNVRAPWSTLPNGECLHSPVGTVSWFHYVGRVGVFTQQMPVASRRQANG